MISSTPMIELRRLHRFFGTTRAVHDVSFEVGAGHVFGYIGPNGAGKTTSMRILATLDLPTAGDAFVDGFSVITDPDRVRRRLGFMPDYFGTYPDINCFEYLDAPVRRVAAEDSFVPTAPNLEALTLPSAAGLRSAAADLLRW